MLLSQLHDQLAPSFPDYAQKDLKTAVRVLAEVLHCPDPQHCSLDHYHQSLPTLYRSVEDYLIAQGKGAHTIRNTKNNLSRLFRLAEEQHLFALTLPVLTQRFHSRDKQPRPGGIHVKNNNMYFPYRQWPSALQNAFTAFQTWATAPVIPGRAAHLRKRMTTIKNYKQLFEGYFGYLHTIEHRSPIFDDLFDITSITHYVHWHINQCHQGMTTAIRLFLKTLAALTRQYRPLPELRIQILALQKTLPIPPPTYNKEDAWVSLATLQEIAHSLWPRRKPTTISTHNTNSPGLYFALRAGVSLMLHIWTYIPLRQRNMREMLLGDTLRKDAQGKWRITFRSAQLKIATKRGLPNVFDVPFPDHLVPLLEEYLATWRPILLTKAYHPDNHVFLTSFGTPFKTPQALRQTTARIVYMYTGKHWHPHIIRTVWATEWIRNGGDFYKAAYMLNDKLETVIKNYAHLRDENVAEEVYGILNQRNSQVT